MATHMDPFEVLLQSVRLVEQTPVPQDEIPDAVGHIRHAETRLADLRRRHQSEIEGTVEGDHYRIVEQRQANRTYNHPAILAEASAAGLSIADLVRLGVVRLSWQWTALQRWFNSEDLTLRTAGHEVDAFGEIDGPHVGTVWKTRQVIEGKTNEEEN